ncbi:hypothetical protein [Peristeroidobacter soli]|jgi:hypothetical protein|uniref:hypothetical protein n=1 Tax=Peristeroidobacter soli TaxID=2497877 RepID=UPI00101DC807|nr:hypothetical protein [Peristeroidobacter soli]
MDPREITRALAIEPIQTIAAGAVTESGVHRLHSESYWIAQLPIASMSELVEGYRAGGLSAAPALPSNKEELFALVGATEWDARILLRIKELRLDANQKFLQQLIIEGGSIALLVDRGEQRFPFVIKRALPKLAQLGIELEID